MCWHIAEKGLYAVLLSLPLTFSLLTNDYFDLPKVTVLRLLTIVILAALAIRALARGRLAINRSRLDIPVLAYLAVCLIATFHTMSLTFSLYGEYTRYEGLITIANYAILFFLAFSLLDSQIRVERALQVLAATAAVVSITGIAQALGLQLYPGDNLAEFQGRVFSTLGNPDFLGSYLVLATPVACGLLLRGNSRVYKGALAAAIILMVVCLTLTYTRGAWIGFVVSIPVFALTGRHLAGNKVWVGIVVVATLVVVGVIEAGGPRRIESAIAGFTAPAEQRLAPPDEQGGGASVMSRIQSSTDLTGGTIDVRLQMWRATLGVIADDPVAGAGLNSLQMAMARYISVEYARGEGLDHMPDKVHNGLLQVAANTGLLGLGAYLAILAAFGWTVTGWLRRNADSAARPLVVGILAGWLGYIVQDMFLFGVVGTSSQFWLLMGAGAALCATRGPLGKREHACQLPKGLPAAGIPAIIVIAACAGFLALKPAIADYYMNLGNRSFHDQMAGGRNIEEGIANYQRAISWAPYVKEYREMYASVLTYRALGETGQTERRRDLDEAAATLNAAIAQNPEHAALYAARAATYEAYGNDHQLDAYRDYRKAVELRPYDYYANRQLAALAHRLGDVDRAIIAERTLLDIFPHDHQATYQLAGDYMSKGRLTEARTLLDRAVRRNPEDAGALFLLALVDEAEGDEAGALVKYESVLKLMPEHEEAKKAMERLAE